MKEKIIKAIIDSLGSLDNSDNTYTIHPFRGEWWIKHNVIGSGEPVKDWLSREIKFDHSEDKIAMEAKQTCVNCNYSELSYRRYPCNNCEDGEKWEPIKTV